MEQNNLNTKTQTTTTSNNKNNVNEQRPGRSNRNKSYGGIIKSRYSKACFILAKIENNLRNGTPHENDQSDRKKCQLVIDEYLKYQESKAEVHKEVDEAPKKQNKAPKEVYKAPEDKMKETTKIITDELCMALANESNGKLKPVLTEWPMIENRMSNILYEYLLHNKNCPIPRYKSGEIYRGFFLIQCQDTFSKDFLSNCITKVRDAFKGMTLTIIPAAQIPENGFDDKTSNTLTTNANTNLEVKEEEFIEAPPPPTWQSSSDDTHLCMEDKKEDLDKTKLLDKEAKNLYQYYLQRYQYFANKGPLKGRDKRKLRRCESKIRKFEIRHGIRTEINEQMNTPQPNEGFQLSVNYFDTDGQQSRDTVAHNPFRGGFPQTSRSSCGREFEGLNHQQPVQQESFNERHISSKTKSNYKRALRFLRNLSEFTNLTYKQQKYKNKYEKMIKRYEEILGINNEMLDCQETQTSNDFRRQQQEISEFPETMMPMQSSNSWWNYHDWDEENYNEMERDRTEFPELDQKSRFTQNSSWNYGQQQAAGYNDMSRHYTTIKQRSERSEHEFEQMPENFTSNSCRTAYPSTASSKFKPELEQMPEHPHNLMANYEAAGYEMEGNNSTSNRPRSEDFSSAASNRFFKSENKPRQIQTLMTSSRNYEAAGNSASNRPRSKDFSSAASNSLMPNQMPITSWNYEAVGYEMEGNNSTSNRAKSEYCSTVSNMFENEPRQIPTLMTNKMANRSWNYGYPEVENYNTTRGNSGQRSETITSHFNTDAEMPAFPQTSNQNLMQNSSLVNCDAAGRGSSCNIDVKTTANTVEESTKAMLEKQIYEFLKSIGDEEDSEEHDDDRQKPTEISKKNSSTKSTSDRVEICRPNIEDKPITLSRNSDPRKELLSYTSMKTAVTAELKRKSDSLRKITDDRSEICRPNIEDKSKTLSRNSDPMKNPELKRKSYNSKTSTEVITLSDDSDNEQDKAEQEYFKALGYLRKLETLDPYTLSEQEKRFQETSRFMVRQFENKFGLKANEASNEEFTRASREKRSRWNFHTRSDMAPTTQRTDKQSRTYENTKSYPVTSSSSWQNSNKMYTNNLIKDMPYILPTQRNPESPPTRIDDETNTDAEHWNPPLETTYPTTTNNPDLQIAIIDRNENDFKIPKISWAKIEQELLQALVHEVEQTNNTNIAKFDGMHWKYGIKIVQCENMDSLNFIKRFIIKLSLKSTSAQYDVIPVKELPRRSIVKVSIPPPNLDDNAIFKILKAQNHTLYTLDWTLINSREMSNKNGKNLYISISSTSLRRLRQIKGEIRYGINRLQVQLPQEDDETSGGNF